MSRSRCYDNFLMPFKVQNRKTNARKKASPPPRIRNEKAIEGGMNTRNREEFHEAQHNEIEFSSILRANDFNY